MDTKKLAYFLRLHENGNITHTAKEAFLTQSALTKMIQGWEEEFHCKLLTRSRKGGPLYTGRRTVCHLVPAGPCSRKNLPRRCIVSGR